MNQPPDKPRIALVQGDAAGIGPELTAKLLRDAVTDDAHVAVFSDARLIESGCAIAGVDRPAMHVVTSVDEIDFTTGLPNLIDMQCIDPAAVNLSEVSAACGGAVLQCFGAALDACSAGRLDGVCFMPFNKASMHAAGLGAEDESQWAKKRVGVATRVGEFNVIDGMWNARVTSHVPLRDVAARLSVDEIVAAAKLAHVTLRAAGFDSPRIAVAALNPHAGDGGAIGDEEITVIGPAVAAAQQAGVNCSGPYPADTLYPRVRDGAFDCALSMYHDQGQIAIKLLGFHMGVSVHGGFPFAITTPAHGTAFDIAGKNRANLEPSRRAFEMATRMASAHTT